VSASSFASRCSPPTQILICRSGGVDSLIGYSGLMQRDDMKNLGLGDVVDPRKPLSETTQPPDKPTPKTQAERI
jgi:hypothetical protein